MLSSTGPVAKLYLSIIDDVIESVRELFSDEGLEDRVLDDLRHLWESKMMQSKAVEGFRKNNINSSNFVLQLPASYSQTDQEVTASVVIPASQNIHSFPRLKSNSETLATFSLPAGLTYPVQIPAGVTLQTASGQLYKVNVPVVVTQAAAGQQPFSQAAPPQSAAVPPQTTHRPKAEPCSAPATSVPQSPHPKTNLPPNQESSLTQQPQPPAAETSQLQATDPAEPEVPLQEKEPQAGPADLSETASPCGHMVDQEEAVTQAAQLNTRDIDDILKEVIEQESEKAERLDLNYNYTELSEIVQLDGPPDNSDMEEVDEEEEEEEEGGAPLEENDFLGLINTEAIKALQEGDGSSASSSSDSEGVDELANMVEEDPLNSGDDVIEQDIPDLFDIDNVIVCQYDKIHRSKNRWKFHLKDGVMSYGGRDYVFSKAVGEAEW